MFPTAKVDVGTLQRDPLSNGSKRRRWRQSDRQTYRHTDRRADELRHHSKHLSSI